jgi:hypothetical membrane protein
MSSSKFVRFSGLIGIIAPIFGLLAVVASTSLWEDFSWSQNALSDIGVSPVSSAAYVFNYSLILVGILNFIFTLGFVKAYAKNALSYLGGIILIGGGGSLSLVGVFTKEYGDLHSYVSFGYFVLFPIAMILVGIAFRRMNMQTRGYASILAGIIALFVILSAIILRWHKLLNLGFAVPEILEAIVIAAWIIWMGTTLIGQ